MLMTTMEACPTPQAREASPSQPARSTIKMAAVSALTPVAKTLPVAVVDSSTSHRPRDKPNALHDIIAGGVGGSAGFLVGHPLDSLKVRSQMAAAGSAGAVATTPALRSLMRGAGAPVTTAAVLNASIFLTYGGCTRAWDERFGASSNDSGMKWAACGGVAGIASAFTMCPTEHVKTKLQTQSVTSSVVYKNSFDAASRIFLSHGIDGLFRGFAATLARQGPGFVVYFSVYERLKEHFGPDRSILDSIAAGGIAGSLSWASIYPIDFVKSRIQALPLDCSKKERSMAHVMREVIRNQGWTALYRGFGVTVLRAFPVNGIIFPTYEITSRLLRDLKLEG